MKHLIKTADSSSLAAVNYNRVILNTTTDNVTIDYSYVDLGLPSGLKWATRNIGATSESDYGDFFMWGSITPNTNEECTWESYKYCNGSDTTLTKYNTDSSYGTVDNITTLEPEDDVATQIMGSEWRMPTKAEIQELIDSTTKQWTQVNGVNGYKFTGSNGNSIFIPAAGACIDGSVSFEGSDGGVWSSSLYSNPGYAWRLDFGSGRCNVSYGGRSSGRSVRGVRA